MESPELGGEVSTLLSKASCGGAGGSGEEAVVREAWALEG